MKSTKLKQNRKGFTLTETLMAVLILVLASVVMVTGITAAIRAYQNMVDKANAQTLLSTTMTKLRTSLTNADDITVSSDGKTLCYTDTVTRNKFVIASAEKGITLVNEISSGEAEERPEEGSADLRDTLVSQEAASRSMHVVCDFSCTGDTVEVSNIKVLRNKDGFCLAELDKSLIKNW